MNVSIEVRHPLVRNELKDVNADDVGSILFYAGSRPRHHSDKATTTLLCEACRVMDLDFFVGNIIADGTCGFIRLISKQDEPLRDASVTTAGGEVIVRNINFVKGGGILVNPSDLNRRV